MTWGEWELLTILVLLVILALLVTLLLMRDPLLFRSSLLFKGTPVSRYAGLEMERRSTSIVQEVFKPVTDPYNQLVDYFRPSNLSRVACSLLPASPAQLPFGMLWGLARGCY